MNLDLLNDLPSPCLVVDEATVDRNIAAMLRVVDGNTARLRPHLKTSKTPVVVEKLLAAGIAQFKCATLAEVHMALTAGARDILMAYQPVGPNPRLLAALAKAWPDATLGCLVDNMDAAKTISEAATGAGVTLNVWVDIDCGMHRSGIPAGQAAPLAKALTPIPGLTFRGLHVYDGHIHDTDLAQRQQACDAAFADVWPLVETLPSGTDIIAGGTPSFAVHAKDLRVTCSPGTSVFWDRGYATIVPDLPFEIAARILTRVISKPQGQLCLDLGHKAIAAENLLEKRLVIPALADALLIGQSEEHLVVQSSQADQVAIGQTLLAEPWHICPTVALYDTLQVIQADGQLTTWPVTARDRRLPTSSC